MNMRKGGLVPFYDLDRQERIRLTEMAIAKGESLHSRWIALEAPEAKGWNARAAAAAEWLQGYRSVLDLGCGTMILESHLADTVRYYPCDIVARDDRTVICDLNLEPPPVVEAEAVACLGLLEYLHQPQSVMAALAKNYPIAVVSYCVIDAMNPSKDRRAHGWVNDFDSVGIATMFEQAGWHIEQRKEHGAFQMLWQLSR